ncbi:MAG: SPOR domain-containing protein [Pseudomonadales bacterium]|nr:SPOR domain-containing protein [Pseudomonadales bacterium]
MAHDFAKKGKTRKKGKKKAQPQAKPWRGFTAGLLTGLVLGPLLYLAMVADGSDSADAQPSKAQSAPAAAKQPAEQASKKADKSPTGSLTKLKNQIEFTFYDRLPKHKTTIEVTPDPIRDPKNSNKIYMLQAGSFRKLPDADQLRAELIMQGLSNTKINSVTRSDSTWHRVQIGPFDSKRVMNKARNVLSRNGIDSLVLSLKK